MFHFKNKMQIQFEHLYMSSVNYERRQLKLQHREPDSYWLPYFSASLFIAITQKDLKFIKIGRKQCQSPVAFHLLTVLSSILFMETAIYHQLVILLAFAFLNVVT